MSTHIKKFSWISIILVLVFTNVATVLNAQVYDLLHNALSNVPYVDLMARSKQMQLADIKLKNSILQKRTDELELKAKIRKQKLLKSRNISLRISNRIVRNIGLNTSSILGESIPYLGVAVILTVTAADVYDGCQTIKDINELLTTMGDAPDENSENEVCGIKLPTVEEIERNIGKYHHGAGSALREYLH